MVIHTSSLNGLRKLATLQSLEVITDPELTAIEEHLLPDTDTEQTENYVSSIF